MKFKCIHCEEENDVDIQDLMQEYVEQGRTEATESFQTEKERIPDPINTCLPKVFKCDAFIMWNDVQIIKTFFKKESPDIR